MRVHDFTFEPVLPPPLWERGLISKCDRNRPSPLPPAESGQRGNPAFFSPFLSRFFAPFKRPLNAAARRGSA